MNKFLITSGENNSIGLEVTLKALQLTKINNDIFIFYANKENLLLHFEKLDLDLDISFIPNPEAATQPGIFAIISQLSPFDWFESATNYCFKNPKSSALITGPLRKKSFESVPALGHTDYFQKRFTEYDLFMTFIGERFNTLLLTDHIPISEVPKKITFSLLNNAVSHVKLLQKRLNLKKPIFLMGLNPHAGEDGLIGSEEENIHKKAVKETNDLKGPFSSDGFFNIESYEDASFFIANYHDQGLIPFKLINGINSSQTTLGLPFIRTSVSHGTAENIFLKNQANASSMKNAIDLAKKLLTYRRSINETQ